MRARVAGRWLVLFVGMLLLPTQSPAQDKVDVKVVKYAGLGETIKQLKGKVVVVDFWADY